MKIAINMRVLAFFFLFFSTIAFTQSDTIRIESVPKQGVLLEKGWKWHSGDAPQWSNPDFDDSQWGAINPCLDINQIPGLKEQSIGWLRTTLSIPPEVVSKSLILVLKQSVASEVYINGRLVEKIGFIGTPNTTQSVSQYHSFTVGIPFPSDGRLLHIALRIGYEKNIFYGRVGFNDNACVRASVVETANIRNLTWYFQKQIYYGWFQVGIVTILTFIHLAFYFLFRTQRANLYFSCATFLLGIAFLSIATTTDFIETASGYFYTLIAETAVFPLAYLFLTKAIYELYERKTGLIFWLLAAIGLLLIGSMFTPFSVGSYYIEMFAEMFMSAEIIRVTWIAIKQQKTGAKFIMVGMVLSFFMFSLFYIEMAIGKLGIIALTTYQNANIVVYQIALIGVPISMSLYLAMNFANINKTLIEKLLENDELNRKNLIQEQDKKQILAKQNDLLEQQVHERTTQLEQSLDDLKHAQNQLVQKEKLASLGELMAGISHEIQNPLNFVNNFSELSVDLAKELKEEIEKELIDKGLVKEILSDLSSNQEKINHHGKRASNIVKGMLEHSRASTGVKELTDISKLAEEYLRLSYHGLRAKDKDFNADFSTDFDGNLPKIEVIPQDIGRVLLNLINNAFYTVHQRKQFSERLELSESYTPAVSVSTQQLDNQIIIKVKDNGTGMPESVRAKVFQPFFTTKPTGQGTGLGLSLAYDIVTKGHGGTLEVESTEGVGTEFIISLPYIL
jgi:two-component system, NtrC family, sensor kinase